MRKLLLSNLFLFATFVAFAQTEAAKDAPVSAVATTSAAETAARSLFAALQNNDTKALAGFVASKATYLEIVANYDYQAEQKRAKAVDAVETGYEKQAASITKSFSDLQAQIKAAGVNIKDCKVSLVQARDRERGNLRGGRALIQLTDAAQHEIVVIVRGFYEFKGVWYVMDSVRLREAQKTAN